MHMATAAVLPQQDWTLWNTSDSAMNPASSVSTSSRTAYEHETATRSSTSNHQQEHVNPYIYTSYAPANPSTSSSASLGQPTSSSSLFSRSELQAIDGFLESFSAPLTYPGASQQPPQNAPYSLPYAASTALYRPDYDSGHTWRGPPTLASSTTYSHLHHQPQLSKYASYHPTAHHRPASPSSASASSSSYPKTLPQADQLPPGSALSAVRPPRASNSPFSSTSHAEESPDDREKRLRSQANDLAGWLSRYNSNGGHVQPSSQQAALRTTMQQSPSGRTDVAYHNSSVYPMNQGQPPSTSSSGSTSNSESLPTPSSKLPLQSAYVDFQMLASHVPGAIQPKDLSLRKPTSAYDSASLPGSSIKAPTAPVELFPASVASVEKAQEKGKTKATKQPARKKTSSTTQAVREQKKPTAKAPNKTVKSASPPTKAESSANPVSPSTAAQEGGANHASTLLLSASLSNTAANKAALTEEQKRANHIASEQKRRHAIRAAYDALCTVVPSLSAAVKEYEDRLSKLHPSAVLGTRVGAGAGEDGMDVDDATGTTPVQTVAGVLTGGIEVGGEKIDGRAGPRSEAVVLAKTVEYMRDLLDQREESLARLQQLHVQLKERRNSTPAIQPSDPSASWNTKWRTRNR